MHIWSKDLSRISRRNASLSDSLLLAMPLPKRPYIASPEQVRISRRGDDAIIEYADSKVATTHLKIGAKQLAAMTDAEILTFWNEHLQANQELRASYNYVAMEIPVGNPRSSTSRLAISGLLAAGCSAVRLLLMRRFPSSSTSPLLPSTAGTSRRPSSSSCSAAMAVGACASCSCPTTSYTNGPRFGCGIRRSPRRGGLCGEGAGMRSPGANDG